MSFTAWYKNETCLWHSVVSCAGGCNGLKSLSDLVIQAGVVTKCYEPTALPQQMTKYFLLLIKGNGGDLIVESSQRR